MPIRAIFSRQAGNRLATEADAAAARSNEAHQRADGRGLAHAIAAEQRADLAFTYGKIHPEQHGVGAIARLEAGDLQHHAASSPR